MTFPADLITIEKDAWRNSDSPARQETAGQAERKVCMKKVLTVLFLSFWLVSGCGTGDSTALNAPVRALEQENPEAPEMTELAGQENPDTLEMAEVSMPSQENWIYVHVCGAVVHEGVYRLPENARVFEALEAAGGLTQDAAGEQVNQARCLSDQERIRVPTRQEAAQEAVVPADSASSYLASSGLTSPDPASAVSRININTASQSDLERLPGIGSARARAIIAYREAHGRFHRPEDLMLVSGIKQATYDLLKDQITAD